MKKFSVSMIVFMSLCIVMNVLGGFIALSLKLPVYIDSMGTIMSAVTLGPISGGIVGILTSMVNGATFDPISFLFIPVQLVIGVSTGLLFRSGKFDGIKSILSIILITVLGSITASIITAIVFNGVTSSGSSIIVAVLKNSGVNIITSVFSTQIFTDLLDKGISFFVVFSILKAMPNSLKLNLYKES